MGAQHPRQGYAANACTKQSDAIWSDDVIENCLDSVGATLIQVSARARKTVPGKVRDRGKFCWRLVPGETDMKTPRLAALPLILPLILAVTLTSLALAGCNTTAGLGRDVAAGGNAVADSARKNKDY